MCSFICLYLVLHGLVPLALLVKDVKNTHFYLFPIKSFAIKLTINLLIFCLFFLSFFFFSPFFWCKLQLIFFFSCLLYYSMHHYSLVVSIVISLKASVLRKSGGSLKSEHSYLQPQMYSFLCITSSSYCH